MFINPPGEYEIYTKENGESLEVLLDILIKAESTETDREMMNFRLIGGKKRKHINDVKMNIKAALCG